MNDFFAYGGLVVAIAAIASSLVGSRATKLAIGVSWLGLIAGFIALYTGAVDGVAAVLGIVSLAAVAVLGNATKDDMRRARITAFGASVALAVAVAGVFGARDATFTWPGQTILFAAQWSALAAALSMTAASAALDFDDRRPVGPGVALLTAGACGAVLLAGTGRATLPRIFYGFPLRNPDGPLYFVVPATRNLEDGISLAVAAPVPVVAWLTAGVAVLALAVGVVSFLRLEKHALTGIGWGAAALAVIGVLGSLPATAARLRLPLEQPYLDYARQIVRNRDADERVLEHAGYNRMDEVMVTLADLGPELFGLTLAGALALVATSACFGLLPRREEADEDVTEIDLGHARDHLLRAVVLLWLAWFLGRLAQIGLFGVTAVGSPSEWVALGVTLSASGVLLATWRRAGTLERAGFALAPGLVGGAILLAAAASYRFGAPFALSLNAF